MTKPIQSMTYLEYLDQPDILTDADKELIKVWSTRNFYSQMMDVWGEVDKLPYYYDKYKGTDQFSSFLNQIERVSRFCKIVRNCPGCTYGKYEGIKIAEWELYDFYLGENTFNNNNGHEAARWFAQWCFDINYDLLEKG